MARSGSAGTLDVTIGAQTGPLAQGMAQGEQAVRRFRRVVDSEAEAVGRASSRMSRGFSGFGRSLGTAAGGLLMLAGTAEETSNTIGGVLARATGSFLAGGPLLAGISLAADAIRAFGKESSSAFAKQQKDAEAAAEKFRGLAGAIEEMRSANRKTATASEATSLGVAPDELAALDSAGAAVLATNRARDLARRNLKDFVARRDSLMAAAKPTSLFGSSDPYADIRAQEAGLLARYREEEDRFRVASERFAQLKAAADKKTEEAEREHQQRLFKIRREIASDEMAKRLREGLDTVARRDAPAEEDRRAREWAADFGPRAAQDRANQLRENNLREQQRIEARRADAEALNRTEAERLGILRAATDLERLQAQHRAEFRREVERVGEPSRVLQRHAEETAQLIRQQADDAKRVAENAERAATAEADAAEAVSRRAEAEKRAAAEAERASKLASYSSGYGPLAQARDAKRANRRLQTALRHEANLNAEAASRFGPTVTDDGRDLWQARSQPSSEFFQRWGLDENGQLKADGWGLRHGEKFVHPGSGLPPPASPSINPSAEDIYGPGGLSALGEAAGKLGSAAEKAKAAGEAVDGAGKAIEGAAEKVTEGAGAVERLADATRTLAGATGDAFAAASAAAEQAIEAVDTLRAQLVQSGFLSG